MTSARSQRNRKGAAVVEFAVLLPILLLVFVAVTETCNVFFLEQTLKTAAYEGARTAIVPGAVEYDVVTKAQEVATLRSVDNVRVDVIPANFETLPLGSHITVEVTAVKTHSSFFRKMVQGEDEITESVTMMKEY